MRWVSVFESISLDGFFCGENGDLRWAHRDPDDEEWNAFVSGNASDPKGTLVMGRKTHDMMAAFWPTANAQKFAPKSAAGMNARPKIVFSRSLTSSTWSNTTMINEDVVSAIRRMKHEEGDPLVILGSGNLVAQLSAANLINRYQFAVVPIALGKGRTLFPDLETSLKLTLLKAQPFKNGNVVLTYEA